MDWDIDGFCHPGVKWLTMFSTLQVIIKEYLVHIHQWYGLENCKAYSHLPLDFRNLYVRMKKQMN